MDADPAASPRPTCYRCLRPQRTCICDRVVPVSNRTAVVVMQHPRERFHPFGTARIARLGLERCELRVCFSPTLEPPVPLPARSGLLYPGGDAVDLATVAPDAQPEGLVVLDGTWPHARRLFGDHPWLHRLPRYGLRPARPGRYRIRREPALHCLSTIEAIVAALRLLEPETAGLGGLLGAFDSMIDEQIRLRREHRADRPRRPRRRRARGGVPRIFSTEPERLVVVYGESFAVRSGPGRAERHLVQWTAARPTTGQHFDCIVGPGRVRPAASHLRHMGLDPAWIEAGCPPADVRRRWRQFLGRGDVVVAYSQSSIDLLRAALGDESKAILLKAAYCNVRRAAHGTIDDVLQREAIRPIPVPVRGRARQRLGNALALLELLQAMS